MCRIITLDAENSGIPEDGFGIDESGSLFVAICRGGFENEKQSLIFNFIHENILVRTNCPVIKSRYRINNFSTLLDIADEYDGRILSEVFDLHLTLSGKSKKKFYFDLHVNSVIQNILTRIYKLIGAYYLRGRVNLKTHKYGEFLSTVLRSKEIYL